MEIDWKYAPVFVPIQEKSFVQSYATLLLIFIFVAIVCLVSAGVIGYTRSITVAIKSKSVLMDVKKLGGDRTYLNRVLKEQVKKVYVLPTIVAAVLMFVYYTLVNYFLKIIRAVLFLFYLNSKSSFCKKKSVSAKRSWK